MKLGINLPWGRYAQDIGTKLATKSGAALADALAKPLLAPGVAQGEIMLDTTLKVVQALGVSCVRMFLLGDGVTLAAPTLDKQSGKWSVNQPVLPSVYQTDFDKILQAFKRQKMQVMPVFVDYQIFQPPVLLLEQLMSPGVVTSGDVPIPKGTKSVSDFVNAFYKRPVNLPVGDGSGSVDWTRFIKRGRAPILGNAGQTQTFLSNTLTPLLNTAKNYPDQIMAWDLINEPEIAIKYAYENQNATFDLVTGTGMSGFIAQGVDMILAAGFSASVGFRYSLALGKDDGFYANYQTSTPLKDEIKKIATMVAGKKYRANLRFVLQWHYYPRAGEQTTLVDASDLALTPACDFVLGEFGTKIYQVGGKSPWGASIAGTDSVLARLNSVKDKGYDWVFPWSATPGLENSTFDASVEQQYQQFTNPPG
jgi:hypothetical protein